MYVLKGSREQNSSQQGMYLSSERAKEVESVFGRSKHNCALIYLFQLLKLARDV